MSNKATATLTTMLSTAGIAPKKRERAVKRRLRTSNQIKGKSGWMDKLRKTKNALGLKLWDRRWISIEKDTVRWYKQPNDKKCSGFINCYEIESVERTEPLHIRIKASYRDLTLRAMSSDDAKRWLRVLRHTLQIWTNRDGSRNNPKDYQSWRAKTKAEHAQRQRKVMIRSNANINRAQLLTTMTPPSPDATHGARELVDPAVPERRRGDREKRVPGSNKSPKLRTAFTAAENDLLAKSSPIVASKPVIFDDSEEEPTTLDLNALADDSDSDDEDFRRSLRAFSGSSGQMGKSRDSGVGGGVRSSVRDLLSSEPEARSGPSRARRFGSASKKKRTHDIGSKQKKKNEEKENDEGPGFATTTNWMVQDFDDASSDEEDAVARPVMRRGPLSAVQTIDDVAMYERDDQTPSMQIASTICAGHVNATSMGSDPDWLTADWD